MAASATFRPLTGSRIFVGRLLYGKSLPMIGSLRNLRCSRRDASDDVPPPSPSETTTEKDPFPVFSDPKVQSLLSKITGFDLLKVAGPHMKPLEKPVYKLLTDDELAMELHNAKERLKGRLQIPPYMAPRKPNLTPLAIDPDLAGHDTSDYVFVDISFGLKDRERSVVIRQPDGTLKVASWDVKERMNEIYNPREGREYLKPKMFEEQNLERMISEKKYIYILDRACCQFEPDDPDFIRVTHRVYNAVDAQRDYEVLRSTRHFGSMSFYLTWNRMIDNLLADMMNRDLNSDAQDLITLYCIVHPDSQCAQTINQLEEAEPAVVIKAYIESESKNKSQLELSLQAMEDARKSKKKQSKGSQL